MGKKIMTPEERQQASCLGDLVRCNPFLPERVELERSLLGNAFTVGGDVWSMDPTQPPLNPNVKEVAQQARNLVGAVRNRLHGRGRVSKGDLDLYESAAIYVLYDSYQEELLTAIQAPTQGAVKFWRPFQKDADRLLGPVRQRRATESNAQLLALAWQIRRAFHMVFTGFSGASMPAARLRAAAWQSVFTQDMGRYRRGLYQRMHEIPTLVTGPSGTGKDLVAQAVGSSSFIPFDEARGAFAHDFREIFLPLNLSALSPSLIESELFGHRKGSFTGAISDRQGYLEGLTPAHTVFLDEIGELAPSIQVKLLQVLQTRAFRRIGEGQERRFQGRIVAATNRDLDAEVDAGRFRVDLYYRLCADRIETPALAELVKADPEELVRLVRLLARRLLEQPEADDVAQQVVDWISSQLGLDYSWPGNVRELEQCVRNVIVRGEYRPLRLPKKGPSGPLERLMSHFRRGSLGADELLDHYVTLVYHQQGGYLPAARILGLDRRTVKIRVLPDFLRDLEHHELS